MTIDTATATPDLAHAVAMAPSQTASGMALAALRIAHSDMATAARNLAPGNVNVDEALQIMDECAEQLQYARRMLTGTIWTM